MTGRRRARRARVEWNPTGNVWKAATVLTENDDRLVIWLDEGGRTMTVERRFTRPIQAVVE